MLTWVGRLSSAVARVGVHSKLICAGNKSDITAVVWGSPHAGVGRALEAAPATSPIAAP